MYSTQGLITAFNRNHGYVHQHVDGLTHAQSLIQPPVGGNCINWIVGHILSYRNNLHALLGIEPAEPLADRRYAMGSAAVTGDGPGVLPLELLMQQFDASQRKMIWAIPIFLTPSKAEEVIEQHGTIMRRADLIMAWMRHESYHAGNLEWLRLWVTQA